MAYKNYFIYLMLSSIKNHNRIAELMQLSPAVNRKKCSVILILLPWPVLTL